MLNGSPISGKGRTGADQPSCFVNAHHDDHHGNFDDDDHDGNFDDDDHGDDENDDAKIGMIAVAAAPSSCFLRGLITDYPPQENINPDDTGSTLP